MLRADAIKAATDELLTAALLGQSWGGACPALPLPPGRARTGGDGVVALG
jgi:hypothetical protein